jgi:hypothetical protein
MRTLVLFCWRARSATWRDVRGSVAPRLGDLLLEGVTPSRPQRKSWRPAPHDPRHRRRDASGHRVRSVAQVAAISGQGRADTGWTAANSVLLKGTRHQELEIKSTSSNQGSGARPADWNSPSERLHISRRILPRLFIPLSRQATNGLRHLKNLSLMHSSGSAVGCAVGIGFGSKCVRLLLTIYFIR